MRRIMCIIFMVMMLITGCAMPSTDKEPKIENLSMFMCVEENTDWRIIVDRKTKVMYAVSCGTYNQGNFTLLVDEEGKPLIYKEGE